MYPLITFFFFNSATSSAHQYLLNYSPCYLNGLTVFSAVDISQGALACITTWHLAKGRNPKNDCIYNSNMKSKPGLYFLKGNNLY